MKKVIFITLGVIVAVLGAGFIYIQSIYLDMKKHVQLSKGQEERIVLVNLANDRASIARQIKTIKNFDPACIALVALFPRLKEAESDSLLKVSISASGILLQTKHQRIGYYGTHKDIMQSADDYGYLEPITEDEFIHSFYLYRLMNEKQDFNLAYKIAEIYDIEKAESYKNRNISQPQLFKVTKLTTDFKKFNSELEGMTMPDIEGKIVLIGYLGPSIEDKYQTYARFYYDETIIGPDMYSTEILANQVLMIMDGVE